MAAVAALVWPARARPFSPTVASLTSPVLFRLRRLAFSYLGFPPPPSFFCRSMAASAAAGIPGSTSTHVERVTAPYGSWKSSITADVVAGAEKRLGGISVAGDGRLVWIETRPEEAGRAVLVKESVKPEEKPVDITPSEFAARTLAQEYGGGAFAVHENMCWNMEILMRDNKDVEANHQTLGVESTNQMGGGPSRRGSHGKRLGWWVDCWTAVAWRWTGMPGVGQAADTLGAGIVKWTGGGLWVSCLWRCRSALALACRGLVEGAIALL
ncbi:hypothetical protein Taro_029114 [Colocasia esculenta]|uniref:Uncharacterized protein n=1 Tax=Colocasia esculenta TaxID=4460 RepID=A0A843VSC3_COLES|nr:hypothetical protein [Colocasia esculenta]